MKLQIFKLFNIIATTILFVEANDNSETLNDNDVVNMDTYYNGELYPYLCSQGCKKDYERYQPCFNMLDNDYVTAGYPELCEVYKNEKCKNFIDDLYKRETFCTKGPGPEDFDVHDEIQMNKIFYLAICSVDAKGQLCDYSNNIHKDIYDPVHLYHMKEDVNATLETSCSRRNCRENLKYTLELLVPLYEYDVRVDTELGYEQEYIENDKRSIAYLSSEACVSQDPLPVNEEKISGFNSIKIISLINLSFISLISILLL